MGHWLRGSERPRFCSCSTTVALVRSRPNHDIICNTSSMDGVLSHGGWKTSHPTWPTPVGLQTSGIRDNQYATLAHFPLGKVHRTGASGSTQSYLENFFPARPCGSTWYVCIGLLVWEDGYGSMSSGVSFSAIAEWAMVQHWSNFGANLKIVKRFRFVFDEIASLKRLFNKDLVWKIW